MKNLGTQFSLISFLFLLPLIAAAQHGSGGAGALGALINLILSSIIFFLEVNVAILNIRAYKNPTNRKARVWGILFSILLLIVSILGIRANAGVFLPMIGCSLALASIIHLRFNKAEINTSDITLSNRRKR